MQLLFEGSYYLGAATIRGQLLFGVWLLFEGTSWGGYYYLGVAIRGQLLFGCGYYSRAATIWGVATIRGH